MLVFHQSLVTLPSHHSSTARAFSHIVLTVSQTDNFSFLLIFNKLLFNEAFQLIKTTLESLVIFFSKYELKIQNQIIDIITNIIKNINLFLIFSISGII
jgi:hypothetical protein